MATTSEQLAQAVAAINALQQTYAQEVGKWQTERTELARLLGTAVAAVPVMRKVFYVDAINGNDTNEGTSAKPFASIEKALFTTGTIHAGSVDIVLKPGVYDVTTARIYRNICLSIFGETQASVDSVVVNWRSLAHEIFNGLFICRYMTLNRHKVVGAFHNMAVIKVHASNCIFGTYIANGVSSTNRSLHFITAGTPLFSAESAGGLVSMEAFYGENTEATPASIAVTRSMNLLYKPVKSILSNFVNEITELQNVRII